MFDIIAQVMNLLWINFFNWDKGSNNYADYHTKYHAPTHHINSRDIYVLKDTHVFTIGFTHNMYPLHYPLPPKDITHCWKFGKFHHMITSISLSKILLTHF